MSLNFTQDPSIISEQLNDNAIQLNNVNSRLNNIGLDVVGVTTQNVVLPIAIGNTNISISGTGSTTLHIAQKNQFTTDWVIGTTVKSKGIGSINLIGANGATFLCGSTSDFFLPSGTYYLKAQLSTISGTITPQTGVTYVSANNGSGYDTLIVDYIQNGISFTVTKASMVKLDIYLCVATALTVNTEVSISNIMLNFGTIALPYEDYNCITQSITCGLVTTITVTSNSYLYVENGGTISNKVTAIKPVSNYIIGWGDSLTAGVGGGGTTYTTILQNLLLDYNVINLGVGGETSWTIASRQGSLPIIIQPCVIPTSGAVAVTLADLENGLTLAPLLQGDGGINPCSLNGIQGTLSYNTGDTKYYFTRTVSGLVVNITRPQPLITYAMQNYRDGILILWLGQNDSTLYQDGSNVIAREKLMIDYLTSITKKYMVIGLSSGTNALNATIDDNFTRAFGRHYINIRTYMANYGLSDAGITPTTQDTTDISNGTVPTSLRVDGVHGTNKFYTIVGTQLYIRGQELGYW